MDLDKVRIVLTRPQGAANVGAVARAMKNMGLGDLALVSPEPMDSSWSRAMAVHAQDVLESAATYDSIAAAVADCSVVFGTTAHVGPYRSRPLAPRQAAAEIVPLTAAGRVAVVFGPEDHGLSNDDLIACHQLISIPASPVYSSLNLAQAVMVCAYELFLAASGESSSEVVSADGEPAASAGDVQFMLARLEKSFVRMGFLLPDNPTHIMHAFREMFGRARLDRREVRILLGLARQIDWLAGQAGRE